MPRKSTKKKRPTKAKSSPASRPSRIDKVKQGGSILIHPHQNVEEPLSAHSAQTHADAPLQEHKEREAGKGAEWEILLNTSPIPIWITRTADCRVITGNQAAAELIGAPLETNVSQTPGEYPFEIQIVCFRAGRELAPHELPMQRAAASGQPVGDEFEIVLPDGREKSLCGRAVPLKDAGGTVTGVIASFADITERKRDEETLRRAHDELEQRVRERTEQLAELNAALEEQLVDRMRAESAQREGEARTRAFLENSATIAWIKDAEGRHVYLSPNYERRFNVRLKDWLGKTDFELWPLKIAEQFRKNDLTVLKENRRIEVIEEALKADGSVSWWLNSKFPFQDASGIRYVGGLGVDITERKQFEEALHENDQALRRSREESRTLAGQLLTALDNERKRIACDLHDDYNQRLAAMVLDLQLLSQSVPDSLREVRSQISAIQNQVETLSDDIHTLAYQLHPSVLDDVGLEVALRDLIVNFRQREAIEANFVAHNVPADIPKAVAGCLYRIAQESLHNVAKHAKAPEVSVTLSGSHLGLGLSVRDTGRGFVQDETKLPYHRGLGLGSMEERLRLVNGGFTVHSRPGNGTKVCAWVPLPEGES